MLAGADRRKLPLRGMFFGGPVSDGAHGNLTLDVYIAGPEREVASVDLDCGMATLDCMAYVTVVNSRWFAIVLQKDLTRAVLFDFGATGELRGEMNCWLFGVGSIRLAATEHVGAVKDHQIPGRAGLNQASREVDAAKAHRSLKRLY